jgi:hypothetical protein
MRVGRILEPSFKFTRCTIPGLEELGAVVRIPCGPVNTNPEELPVEDSNCAIDTPEESSRLLPTTN